MSQNIKRIGKLEQVIVWKPIFLQTPTTRTTTTPTTASYHNTTANFCGCIKMKLKDESILMNDDECILLCTRATCHFSQTHHSDSGQIVFTLTPKCFLLSREAETTFFFWLGIDAQTIHT